MWMRRALLIAVLVGCSTPAHAQSWSLGSHLGFTHITNGEESSGSSNVSGWPSSTIAYQPALRVGVSDSSHAHEVILDSGLLLIDEGGSDFSQFTALLGYQHTFLASRAFAPFASASIGLFREGGVDGASTDLMYGFGVGGRRTVSERHGAVRAEIRYDRLGNDPRTGRPELRFMSIRLGFDLWL